jgi:hypothetical protein
MNQLPQANDSDPNLAFAFKKFRLKRCQHIDSSAPLADIKSEDKWGYT